jgi:phage shock protein PspC (stress-responsive transcriptional regulator)
MNATHDFAAGNGPSGTHQAGIRALSRPDQDRMLGGVAAGLARSAGVDPLLVRLAFVVLTLIGGAGVPLYLAGWLLIPDEATGQSLAGQAFQSISARSN